MPPSLAGISCNFGLILKLQKILTSQDEAYKWSCL